MFTPENLDAAAGMPIKKDGICVPLKALSIDGTPPEADDDVEFTTKGKVSRVDGENAYVTPAEINGEPVTMAEEETEPEPAKEPDSDDMMRVAEEADKKNA